MVLTGQTEYEIGRKNPEVPSKFLNVYDFGIKSTPLSQSHLSFSFKKSCDWLRGELFHAKIKLA